MSLPGFRIKRMVMYTELWNPGRDEIFVVLFSVLIFCFNFYSAQYWKEKMINRLKGDIFFYFFFNSFCFNFFSGKYWKRNRNKKN